MNGAEGVVEVQPSSGKVFANDKQRVLVRFKPGIPETLCVKLKVEVAHFEPVEFPIYGEGIYARVGVSLPRDSKRQPTHTDPASGLALTWPESLEVAKQLLLTPDPAKYPPALDQVPPAPGDSSQVIAGNGPGDTQRTGRGTGRNTGRSARTSGRNTPGRMQTPNTPGGQSDFGGASQRSAAGSRAGTAATNKSRGGGGGSKTKFVDTMPMDMEQEANRLVFVGYLTGNLLERMPTPEPPEALPASEPPTPWPAPASGRGRGGAGGAAGDQLPGAEVGARRRARTRPRPKPPARAPRLAAGAAKKKVAPRRGQRREEEEAARGARRVGGGLARLRLRERRQQRDPQARLPRHQYVLHGAARLGLRQEPLDRDGLQPRAEKVAATRGRVRAVHGQLQRRSRSAGLKEVMVPLDIKNGPSTSSSSAPWSRCPRCTSPRTCRFDKCWVGCGRTLYLQIQNISPVVAEDFKKAMG